MSTTQVLRSRFPRGIATAERFAGAPGRFFDSVGHVAWFVIPAMGSIGHALHFYRKETLRLIAEIGMGTGAMAVIGGTSAIVGFVSLSGSSLVVIPGLLVAGQHGVRGVHRLLPRHDQRTVRRPTGVRCRACRRRGRGRDRRA